MVLYDHQTESLWSQLLEKAIAGPQVGKTLRKIPAERIGFEAFQAKHPQGLVLSTDTGYRRNYSVDPYEGYYRSAGVWFPVGDVRKELSPKARVMGLEVDGKSKAYPIDQLRHHPSGTLVDKIGTTVVRIEISPSGEILSVRDEKGEALAPIFGYWFAWQAFHADTQVYQGP